MGVFIYILYLISLLRFVVAGLTTHEDIVLIFGCFHTFRWWQQSSHVSLKQWVDKARVTGNHNGSWEIRREIMRHKVPSNSKHELGSCLYVWVS
jgi:hypothetical protein